MTADRHKPNHCYYRPNRLEPRKFRASDVARLYCRGISAGDFSQSDFLAEVNNRCGWGKTDDWRERYQEVFDAIERILKELLEQLGPGAIAKILGRLYKMIPLPIRRRFEAWLSGVVKQIGKAIVDALEKLKRLPPPPP